MADAPPNNATSSNKRFRLNCMLDLVIAGAIALYADFKMSAIGFVETHKPSELVGGSALFQK